MATKAEDAKCQKCHDLQSNYHFQPVAIETTGVYSKSTAPVLSGLAKKLVDVSGDPRERQWLHQCLSLSVVRRNAASISWPVCKFALILSVLFLVAFNVLTSIADCHLPLYQCISIVSQILILSVSFIIPSVAQCYLAHWSTILSIAWSMDDESTAWCYICSTLLVTLEFVIAHIFVNSYYRRLLMHMFLVSAW